MQSPYHKCKADPDAENFVKNFKALHPNISKVKMVLGKITEESFYRYVVLTYDKNSPFVIRYKDWAQRRNETAKHSKFPRASNKWDAEVENILLGFNPQANKVILEYLFLQNDIMFTQYQAYQALYKRQVKASLEEVYENPGHYEKLKKNIDSLATELRGLETAIFHGNESNELRKALYDFASKISTDFRPEEIAERKEEKEEVVDTSPYPDGYKPEEMSFVGDE